MSSDTEFKKKGLKVGNQLGDTWETGDLGQKGNE